MKFGVSLVIKTILSLLIVFILSKIKPLESVSDWMVTGSLVLFVMVMISYVTSFLGRSPGIWFGGFLGGIIGYSIAQEFGLIMGSSAGFCLDYGVSKYYQTKHLEIGLSRFRKKAGGLQSKIGFIFGGGKSGGGGSQGGW